jgi:lactoylglutathione lyase
VDADRLRAKGIEVAEPESADGSADFLATWIMDPDGNRIELVQWSSGHPDGITAGDWSYGNGAGRLLRRM